MNSNSSLSSLQIPPASWPESGGFFISPIWDKTFCKQFYLCRKLSCPCESMRNISIRRKKQKKKGSYIITGLLKLQITPNLRSLFSLHWGIIYGIFVTGYALSTGEFITREVFVCSLRKPTSYRPVRVGRQALHISVVHLKYSQSSSLNVKAFILCPLHAG